MQTDIFVIVIESFENMNFALSSKIIKIIISKIRIDLYKTFFFRNHIFSQVSFREVIEIWVICICTRSLITGSDIFIWFQQE